MEEHHKAVIEEMKEKKQWMEDNGPIVIDLNNYFKYSGEIEETGNTTSGRPIPRKQIKPCKNKVRDFVKIFSRPDKHELRASIIYRHLRYPHLSIKQLSERHKCTTPTVKNALNLYYENKKLLKTNYRYFL